jgi:hypothetical protein
VAAVDQVAVVAHSSVELIFPGEQETLLLLLLCKDIAGGQVEQFRHQTRTALVAEEELAVPGKMVNKFRLLNKVAMAESALIVQLLEH